MADEPKPERYQFLWDKGRKNEAMEDWGQNVMRDQRSTRGEIKVAWTLSFMFNGDDGRAWPTHESVAEKTGLGVDSVREAIRGLVANGHLIRRRELVRGQPMYVNRPARNYDVVAGQRPRARRSTKTALEEVGNPSPVGVGNPSTPCIPEVILERSLIEEPFIEGRGREPFDLDDELPSPEEIRKRRKGLPEGS